MHVRRNLQYKAKYISQWKIFHVHHCPYDFQHMHVKSILLCSCVLLALTRFPAASSFSFSQAAARARTLAASRSLRICGSSCSGPILSKQHRKKLNICNADPSRMRPEHSVSLRFYGLSHYFHRANLFEQQRKQLNICKDHSSCTLRSHSYFPFPLRLRILLPCSHPEQHHQQSKTAWPTHQGCILGTPNAGAVMDAAALGNVGY